MDHGNDTLHPTALLPRVALDVALFQTVRGSWWRLGNVWVGCSVSNDFHDAARENLGGPLGRCAESDPGSGIFTRAWSNGTSSVDCGHVALNRVRARERGKGKTRIEKLEKKNHCDR